MVKFVIESREGAGQWQAWPHLVPFSVFEDAAAQARQLRDSQPAPTRFASTTREFRVVERPVGCPRCIETAVGPMCAWHALKESQRVTVPAPRPMPVRPTLRPSARPRNLDGSFTTRRFVQQMEAIGQVVRQARTSAERGGAE